MSVPKPQNKCKRQAADNKQKLARQASNDACAHLAAEEHCAKQHPNRQ